MSLRNILAILIVLCQFSVGGQSLTQTIRGQVLDATTEVPLTGANIVIMQNDSIPTSKGAVSDENGYFRIVNVPVGKINLLISYIGYNPKYFRSMAIASGKEMVLNIKLEEKIYKVKEISISANSKKNIALNKMAVVSARSFTIEETERYAGSLGDPARMATNYAGVRVSSDQVNDIIIRGNSPAGLLWQLEGVNIPNPNHFGSMGSTGGPISMLNNNVLSNSDFFTSAFPAEYGNALAGVFDLNLRTGNNEKREYVAQFGFNGFELGVEGPFSLKKKKSSYIANYRYSNLDLFNKAGFDFGLTVLPVFQDFNFKIDIPVKKMSKLKIFGLGGINSINADFGNDSIDSKYQTNTELGILGMSFNTYINSSFQLKMTVATTYQNVLAKDYKIVKDSIWDSYVEENEEQKFIFSSLVNKKFNAQNNLRVGFSIENIYFNYHDSFYYPEFHSYFNRYNMKDDLQLIQSFMQWKHLFSEDFKIVAGLHHQQLSINNEVSIEPRFGANWYFKQNQNLSFGYGMHSQSQPRFVYFVKTLTDPINHIYSQTNLNLKFSKTHHFVLGYDWSINETLRLKVEGYYQSLFDIPVESTPSYLSMVNYGASFMSQDIDSLINKGTATNYGIEFTFEKFLSKHFYYLATFSLFNSKYIGSDGIERNTMFNGNYVINILGGYELMMKNQNSFLSDIKLTWAGGTRKIPIDLEKSILLGKSYYVYDEAYEIKNPDYYKIDFKITYKINRKKSTHLLAVDISNLTNHKNSFVEYYDNSVGEIVKVGQIGIIPSILYRLQF